MDSYTGLSGSSCRWLFTTADIMSLFYGQMSLKLNNDSVCREEKMDQLGIKAMS